MEQNARALYNQGYCYYTGNNNYPLNYKKGFELFQQSAQLGCSEAMNALGTIYENGNIVPQNMRTAAEWFYKAFKADSKNAQATYNLARMYYHGTGVPMNMDKAYQLLDQASKTVPGDSPKLYANICYLKGLIAMNEYKKYTEAANCYHEAVKHGQIPEAYNNLGYMFEKNWIKRKNSSTSSTIVALEYYEQAALLGFVPAMDSTARLYLLYKENATAIMWLQKAIEKGYEPSKKRLKMLQFSESGSLLDLL